LPRLKRRLDNVDVAILRYLSEDCWVSLRKLSQLVGVSEVTLRARIRRLRRLGVLLGCRAYVSIEKLGGFTAMLSFKPKSIESL